MLWMPTAQKKVFETGPQVVNKFPRLEAAAAEVTDRRSKYKLLKNNCNTAASHILNEAGVAAHRPGALYFGWGKRLGQSTDEGDAQQQDQAQAGGNQPQGPQAGGGLHGVDEWERYVNAMGPDENQEENEWDF